MNRKLSIIFFLFLLFMAGLWLKKRQAPLPAPQTPASSLVDAASLSARMGGAKMDTGLEDFGKLQQGAATYYELAPTSPENVAGVIKLAYEHRIPVRTRGRGHSMNGASLPQTRELLLRTGNLVSFRVEEPGTITVGAGITLYSLNEWVSRYGYELPVMNDGGPGPSVGGYLAAGGIGYGAEDYGGFWENVRRVTLVDGTGQLRTFRRGDDEFPWLFGSMGQLGVFVEVTLDLLPIEGFVKEMPQAGSLSEVWESDSTLRESLAAKYAQGRTYWFTLFVPPAQLKKARQSMAALQSKYSNLLVYRPGYTYPIKFRRFNPPLIYPEQKSFVALGVWGDAPANGADLSTGLASLLRDFMALGEKPGYRHYVQAEITNESVSLERYFGRDIYAQLYAYKQRFDPAGILNPGGLPKPAPQK